MTLFWLIATVLIAVAMLFVLIPLLKGAAPLDHAGAAELNVAIRKDQLKELAADLEGGTIDQDQYDQGVLEVERGLLEESEVPEQPDTMPASRIAAMVTGVLIPALAVTLYFQLGSLPHLMDAEPPMASHPEQKSHALAVEELAGMVQTLADRLAENPNDPEGWMMLGRSYAVLRRFDEAVAAYEMAYKLIGDNPDLLADYADVVAMAGGGDFNDASISLIEKALAADPTHMKSLWLMGTVAYERRDYPTALEYWQRLEKLVPPGSEQARAMQANIAEVRGLMGEAPPLMAEAPAQTGVARVSGTVSVDAALAGKAAPDNTVFIFAKAVSGPPMPLAVQRARVSDLPVSFTLDETMSMMPGMSMANQQSVMVSARISRTGAATASSGDLQSAPREVTVGSEGIELVIDQVVP